MCLQVLLSLPLNRRNPCAILRDGNGLNNDTAFLIACRSTIQSERSAGASTSPETAMPISSGGTLRQCPSSSCQGMIQAHKFHVIAARSRISAQGKSCPTCAIRGGGKSNRMYSFCEVLGSKLTLSLGDSTSF